MQSQSILYDTNFLYVHYYLLRFISSGIIILVSPHTVGAQIILKVTRTTSSQPGT